MDVKGSMSIKKLYPEKTFSIFIMPPSIEHLRNRLKNRGTDSEKRIEIRLKRFKEEMEFQNKFDYVMVNENLELAKIQLQNKVKRLKQGEKSGT
jgi:guanylate kinase